MSWVKLWCLQTGRMSFYVLGQAQGSSSGVKLWGLRRLVHASLCKLIALHTYIKEHKCLFANLKEAKGKLNINLTTC